MARNKFERFFWAYLMVNPFLDVISGIYIRYIEISNGAKFEELSAHLTPSFYVRAAVLLLFAAYLLILRDRKAIVTALSVMACWVGALLCGYFVFDTLDIFKDARYIANYVSNLAVLFVYARVFSASGEGEDNLRERLDKIIRLTLIVYSAAIIIPYVFGIGYSTYTDRFGFRGARGFFYSGNDITAALMLLLPVSCAAFMKGAEKTLSLSGAVRVLAPSLAVNALCLIGTKTAFLAVSVSLLALGLYASLNIKKNPALIKRLCALALGTVAVFAFLAIVSGAGIIDMIINSLLMPGSIAETEDAATAIFSGRLAKMLSAFAAWRDGGFLVWLFGTGRAMHERTIEMDVLEVLFYYGILGSLCMLWPYWKSGLGYAVNFVKGIKKREVRLVPLACLLSITLGAAYLFLAGHVLFSATSGFYFSLMLLYCTVGEKASGIAMV